jgi:hypothetical protein
MNNAEMVVQISNESIKALEAMLREAMDRRKRLEHCMSILPEIDWSTVDGNPNMGMTYFFARFKWNPSHTVDTQTAMLAAGFEQTSEDLPTEDRPQLELYFQHPKHMQYTFYFTWTAHAMGSTCTLERLKDEEVLVPEHTESRPRYKINCPDSDGDALIDALHDNKDSWGKGDDDV